MAEGIVAFTNRVVVAPETTPEMVGTIHVPDLAKEKIPRGVVLAAGPDAAAAGLKAGDYVLYSPYAGQKARLDGKEVLVLFLSEVHGRICNTEP